MIKGICRTNLDNFERETWPTNFCAVPRIGERVSAHSGKTLKVVSITHAEQVNLVRSLHEPRIIVELNK